PINLHRNDRDKCGRSEERWCGRPKLPLGSLAPIAEVPDLVAVNRAGLVLVTRLRPAAGAHLEIAGLVAQPFELVAVAAHDHQGMAQVDRMVGAEAKLAARLE